MKYANILLIGLAGLSTQSEALKLEQLTQQTPISTQVLAQTQATTASFAPVVPGAAVNVAAMAQTATAQLVAQVQPTQLVQQVKSLDSSSFNMPSTQAVQASAEVKANWPGAQPVAQKTQISAQAVVANAMKSGVVSTSIPTAVSTAQTGMVQSTNLAATLDSGAIQNLLQNKAVSSATNIEALPVLPSNLAQAAQTVTQVSQPTIAPIVNAQIASLQSAPTVAAVAAPTEPQSNALEQLGVGKNPTVTALLAASNIQGLSLAQTGAVEEKDTNLVQLYSQAAYQKVQQQTSSGLAQQTSSGAPVHDSTAYVESTAQQMVNQQAVAQPQATSQRPVQPAQTLIQNQQVQSNPGFSLAQNTDLLKALNNLVQQTQKPVQAVQTQVVQAQPWVKPVQQQQEATLVQQQLQPVQKTMATQVIVQQKPVIQAQPVQQNLVLASQAHFQKAAAAPLQTVAPLKLNQISAVNKSALRQSANNLAQTLSHLSDAELFALNQQGFFTSMIQTATKVAQVETQQLKQKNLDLQKSRLVQRKAETSTKLPTIAQVDLAQLRKQITQKVESEMTQQLQKMAQTQAQAVHVVSQVTQINRLMQNKKQSMVQSSAQTHKPLSRQRHMQMAQKNTNVAIQAYTTKPEVLTQQKVNEPVMHQLIQTAAGMQVQQQRPMQGQQPSQPQQVLAAVGQQRPQQMLVQSTQTPVYQQPAMALVQQTQQPLMQAMAVNRMVQVAQQQPIAFGQVQDQKQTVPGQQLI